ncbi:High-affnity carbon uptake protein Hat/HatR [Geitlerinema sp. FC II]|nr:High-affnity carbon uptake protein Hat/HatR [Geitlerinema sp. FC II]
MLPAPATDWVGDGAENALLSQASETEAERLYREGAELYRQGTPEAIDAAIALWERALTQFRARDDLSGEAAVLSTLGGVYASREEYHQRAIDYLDRALELAQRTDNPSLEATTLFNLGELQFARTDFEAAVETFEAALQRFRALEDTDGEAAAAHRLGRSYAALQQFPEAVELLETALSLARGNADSDREARVLESLGDLSFDRGEFPQARNYYEELLAVRQGLGDPEGEAFALDSLGTVYFELGDRQQAIVFYEEAIALFQQLQHPEGAAIARTNLARAYVSLGQYRAAKPHLDLAATVFRHRGDRVAEAQVLNLLGEVYNAFGEGQRALDVLDRARQLLIDSNTREGAETLTRLGNLYASLGDRSQALAYYERVLSLYQRLGDESGMATTFNNLGNLSFHIQDTDRALDYYEQALQRLSPQRDRGERGRVFNNVGRVYASVDEDRQALEYFDRALQLRRDVGDLVGQAATLNNIGSSYISLGEFDVALDALEQSLSLQREIGDRFGEVLALANVAIAYRQLGRLGDALTTLETALEDIETLRTKVVSPDLRMSYFATVQNNYELYIDLLMELHRQQPNAGYDARAFHASERARARSLLDLLAEADVNLRRGIPPALVDRERNLRAALNAAAIRQQQLWGRSPSEDEVVAVRREIQQLETELETLEGQIRQTSPEAAALKYPEPLTLAEVQQQVTDDETVLLQYFLGGDRSFVWVVTPETIASYELPSREAIERLAIALRRVLSDPYAGTRDLEQTARSLSNAILAPVADRLGEKRLLVVADGILQALPFSVLAIPDASSYTPLLERHEIVNAPSASMVAIVREFRRSRPPSKTLAIVADPVFGDGVAGLSVRGDDDLGLRGTCYQTTPSPLPGTATEAEGISALVPTADVLTALEFDATRQLVTSDVLSDYRIVHLATHGCFDEVNPRLSALALSLVDSAGHPLDGYLRLHDIYNLDLPADLVVLSACQTAVGETVRGEGVVGLTRGFFQAGTSRSIASLWSVSDASTAHLMQQFYRNYLEAGMTPSEALRAAQLEMWRGEVDAEWKNPFYWAAFVFQGEWR